MSPASDFVPQMPRDTFNDSIPVLGYAKATGQHAHAVTATNTRIGPFNDATSVITVYSTQAAWGRMGDNTVVATKPSIPQDNGQDFFIPAAVSVDIAIVKFPAGAAYLSMVRDGADGTAYVAERA